ncbi:MAG: serine hydrolase domain-containing protein [Myxococcaceae bacterium]|nr:serine hydrolase domain-containing protein [Myxococcaceae bacterium]
MRPLALPMLVYVAACGGAALGEPPPCPPSGFEAHPRHAEYLQRLEAACRAVRAPGCVVTLDRAGEAPWAGSVGWANLSDATPLCVDTPLRVGSVSKPVVAALTMKLVEEGALGLEDTLAQRVRRLEGKIPSADRITVEHLLGHRSGIRNPESQDLFAQTDYFDRPASMVDWSLERRFEQYVYGRPLLFEPGTSQRYSNPGYDLLGWVIEAAAGASLEAVLQSRVATPLGLTSMSFERRDDPAIPPGYTELGDGQLLDVTVTDKANVNAFSPSGGLVSTAGDVRRFMRSLFAGRLVSPASLAVLSRGEGNNRQGLFALELPGPVQALGHQGALVGQSTWALFVPEKDLVLVFSSTMSGSSQDLAALAPFLD